MGRVVLDFTWPLVVMPTGVLGRATLMEDWTVRAACIEVTVPTGTTTDGASIPRILWWLCGHPLESPRVYAALVHDYLYGARLKGVSRKQADRVYMELLVRYGWCAFGAWAEYAALRLFGWTHWRK